MEILPLNRCDAKSIYSTTAQEECTMWKDGWDGLASSFEGKQFKHETPHAIFIHWHRYKFQLAIVKVANSTNGIKHVYTTLTTLR